MASIEAFYSKPAITVHARASAADAAAIMVERRVGAVVVLEDGGVPVGIVGERELVTRVLARSSNPRSVPVSEITLRNVEAVSPHEAPARCSEIMKRAGVRHLLVREGDALLGVVSMRDVIRALLDERESEVRQLTDYIIGPGA